MFDNLILIGHRDFAMVFVITFQILAAWQLKYFECFGRIKMYELTLVDDEDNEWIGVGVL